MGPTIAEHTIPSDPTQPIRTTRVIVIDRTPCWAYTDDGTPEHTGTYTGMIAVAVPSGDHWQPRLIAQLRVPNPAS